MVKLIGYINQEDLPSISSSSNEVLENIKNACNTKQGIVYPLVRWNTMDSFDYQQYYDKKRGLETYKHARTSFKPDENFKRNKKSFFYFKNYKTLYNVSKYNYLVNPYCELDDESLFRQTGGNIYENTINEQGIKGRLTNTPIIKNNTEINNLTPNLINKIKGNIPYKNCVTFKYGFKSNKNYSFS